MPPSIITLDVSQNELTSGTAWVHKLRRLRSLKAAHNRIDALPFAGELHGLTSLDLSHNFLAADEMLIATEIHCLPPSLRHLDLSHNGLATLERLPPLPHLMTLEVAHNQLDNFDGLAACSTLCELNLAHNALATVAQLAPLKSLQGLHSLRIAGNPLCDFEGYRLHALCPLPQLHTLDGGAAAVEERVKAINVTHGARRQRRVGSHRVRAFERAARAASGAAERAHLRPERLTRTSRSPPPSAPGCPGSAAQTRSCASPAATTASTARPCTPPGRAHTPPSPWASAHASPCSP